MFARVSTYHGADAEKFAQSFESVGDDVERLAGFSGAYLLVDRASDKALTITLWDSEDALTSSVETASEIRKRAADTGGYSIDSVEHYEVATTINA